MDCGWDTNGEYKMDIGCSDVSLITIRWVHNATRDIAPDRVRYTMTDNSRRLIVRRPAAARDTGTYTCIAQYKWFTTDALAHVTIIGKSGFIIFVELFHFYRTTTTAAVRTDDTAHKCRPTNRRDVSDMGGECGHDHGRNGCRTGKMVRYSYV